MVKVKITPGKLAGQIALPTSKSHTIRALLFALMAKGKSVIRHPLPSPDTLAMLNAIRHLGAVIDMDQDALFVEGVGGKLQPAEDVIQCGNSGQVLRFIGALAALSDNYTILTGDLSIRHNRPVAPLLNALTQLGASAVSSRLDGYAPIIVKGPLKGGKATLDGRDSQPVSGLLILGAFTPLELHVTNPGEKPWVALTLHWFDKLGIPYENQNYEHYKMKGNTQLKAFEYTVPGDFSSAAFPLVAALITESEITLNNLDMHDIQGDKAIIPALESMGAEFEWNDRALRVKKGGALKGARIDINDFIDALPILAVAGCFASGETEIVNAAIARKKESDRIHCIAEELKKMGAQIEERPDGLIIRPSNLRGSPALQSHHDHRLAMALSVAALRASGESVIDGIECVGKSYPIFFDHLVHLGAKIGPG
ncbi:MAG: 3-phosphoshikimate 1-carboxyvinyltransferase [Verrucomicrobia bacterium]|nr:3-phosphoshikimate 1-carboxyvinyltransferase [Verrucomicrobiota bacterium]MBU6445955.1 3-phosphoshikimate 1-carboxyvinyltransferase [Verrucomicrobiota bacterium]MDE3047276.1 3-phosphoshikimate 1-carboxyvinyltransferase [Verrucomicrobiota bacterium]